MNEVIAHIREHHRFLVCSHVRPDGDAVGSALALHRILDKLGKESTVVLHDGVPERMTFLADAGDVRSPARLQGDWDVAIFVDTPTPDRSGYPILEERPAPIVLNVDHHQSNELYGDVNWIVPEGPATAFMILELCHALGVTIDAPLATQLFVGLMTDTGYFRFDTATTEVFAAAAELSAAGAQAHDLHRRIYGEKPLAEVRRLGDLLSRINTAAEGRIGWIELSGRDVEDVDLAALFSNLTSAREVEICFCLRERRPDLTLVELRSKGKIDVSELAAHFGGGGHRNASGCVFHASAERARSCLLPLLTEALADGDEDWRGEENLLLSARPHAPRGNASRPN